MSSDSSAAFLSCSLPSPGHGPAERAGEPAHSQPAGGHLGPAAPREPERERPGLQGNAPSHGLALSSRSPYARMSSLNSQMESRPLHAAALGSLGLPVPTTDTPQSYEPY